MELNKPVATAEEIRGRIVKHGASIRDTVVETLPHTYSMMVEQIRSIASAYKNDLDTFIANILNIKNLDLLIIYIISLSILNKYKNLTATELSTFSNAYERYVYDVFSASKLRRALEEVVDREVANEVVSGTIRAVNIISNKYKSLNLWIIKQKKILNFEKDIRKIIFRDEGGIRVGRGVKLFLRTFIHETNIPLAVRIAYTQEHRKYLLHGDIYTTLVTIRSGAFEDVKSMTAERVKARIAKRILCQERGGKCSDVVLRLGSIRGLVRYVGKVSGDPVLFERGAYDIGIKYCKELKCDVCPIRDVCKRYTFVRVK